MTKNINLAFELETATQKLDENIKILHCIETEYFGNIPEEHSKYLYKQLQTLLKIVRKSLQCTKINMQKSVAVFYNKQKKRRW